MQCDFSASPKKIFFLDVKEDPQMMALEHVYNNDE